MENLNIALIGCGMIGREHIERIQNRIRGAQIVAVCDVFEEGAKKGAEIAGAGTKVYTDFNLNNQRSGRKRCCSYHQVSSTRVRFWQRSRPASRYSPRSRWRTPLLTARRSLRPRWQAANTSYRLASCAVTTAATVRLEADRFRQVRCPDGDQVHPPCRRRCR